MLKILLADDHQILREGIRRGLEGAGESVVGEASDGEEAIELARSTNPDIVLMDLSMPELDGVAATRALTDASPQIAVVLLSIGNKPQEVAAGLAGGAAEYLAKGDAVPTRLKSLLKSGDVFLTLGAGDGWKVGMDYLGKS